MFGFVMLIIQLTVGLIRLTFKIAWSLCKIVASFLVLLWEIVSYAATWIVWKISGHSNKVEE